MITQLEDCVIAAQRLGDQELVQVNPLKCTLLIIYSLTNSLTHLVQHVGVVLWGMCLPLLQPNLRIRLSHTLTTLASALEQVDR